MRPTRRLALLLLMAAPLSVLAAPVRKQRLEIIGAGALPDAMSAPEGRTRWNLEEVGGGGTWVRTFDQLPGGAVILSDGPGGVEGPAGTAPPESSRGTFSDPASGDAVERWLFPDHFTSDLQPGSRQTLRLDRRTAAGVESLRIEIETVGVGWLHLPSSVREVALQRALVEVEGGGARTLVHRWVDPLAGVVAEVEGPSDADGLGRLGTDSAWVRLESLTPEAVIKMYVDQVESHAFDNVNYGWDLGKGAPISSMTPNAYPNIGALIGASSWDFSGDHSGNEAAATTTPINSG